jgi:predicted MFS family arabinose efflux permease
MRISSIPPLAIVALALAGFASSMSSRITDPLLPLFASEFGVSLGKASHVVSFFAIAYGVAQLFFGPVGDRFGKYCVIAWACAACALTATLCALAPNLPLLLLARLAAGGTVAALIPLSMAWIGDVVPYDQRQPVLARFLIGQILGIAAGQLAGGLAAEHLSWRLPFVGLALWFAVVSVLLFAMNRRLPASARTVGKMKGRLVSRMISEFAQVVSQPWARVILFTVFLEGACLFGAFAFIATHLNRVYGLTLSAAGSLVMLFGFGGLLFAAASASMLKRLGEVGLARWGGLCLFAALLAIGIGRAWWWAIPGCLLAGLGYYMLHNTLQTNATQMAPERRGAAVAAFASCFFLGQSVGVALAGLFVEHVGTGIVISIGAIGVLAVALNFSRRRSRSLRQPSLAIAN